MNKQTTDLYSILASLGMAVPYFPTAPMQESEAFKRKCMGTSRDKEKMAAAEIKRQRRRERNLKLLEKQRK